jgi:hypothetical protein
LRVDRARNAAKKYRVEGEARLKQHCREVRHLLENERRVRPRQAEGVRGDTICPEGQSFFVAICTLILPTRNMASGNLCGPWKYCTFETRNAARNRVRDVMEM